MDSATRDLVRERAGRRCEYCLLSQNHCELTHHIEHIVPRKHGGSDDAANLALACHRCNMCKGPNLSGLDPRGERMVPLFNPRMHQWLDHFKVVEDFRIEGRTPTG